MQPSSMRVVHPDPAACDEMRGRVAGVPGFEVFCGSFPLMPAVDCFVTAGNCYGIMNAGIDASVRARFGPGIMPAVQRTIVGEFFGEQPIGTAFALRTNDPDFPVLIHAPTMRVPGSIVGTDNVYLATFAALVAAAKWTEHRIESIAFPAMGTGFGRVPFDECARQMSVAWKHFQHPPTTIGENWDFVLDRERAITTDAGRAVVK
jgi:O-acetyl-ADP-ribose deacetylase (regulator of RNase III)